MRKFFLAVSVLCGGVLAVGLGAGLAGATSETVTPAAGSGGTAAHPSTPFAAPWYQLYAPYLGGGKVCLDPPGGSATPGKQLQLYRCHAPASGSQTQRWEFVPIGTTGHYHVENVSSGLCIGLDANEDFAGNAVTQTLCGVAPWWDVVSVNDHSPMVYIKAVYYNLVITADTADGAGEYLIAQPIGSADASGAPDPAQMFQLSAG